MRLHRIALAENSGTAVEAFSGKGGLFGKGRWHNQGRLIVYSAEHSSLAMSEALVHLQRSNSIAAYVRWEIDIPEVEIIPVPTLPAGWENDQSYSRNLGDAWLASKNSVAMLVPSAIVANERNCLINPAHPNFSLSWIVAGPLPFLFDRRLTTP